MMDPITMAKNGAAGLMSAATSFIGGGARKKEQAAANAEFNKSKADFNNLDTSNLYENQSNAFEDLTVQTKQADFQAQQNQQNQANMMGSMGAAAGGSGIAALAQAMIGQQSQQSQAAGISIGNQEMANQQAVMGQENKMQANLIAGESSSRKLKASKVETQFGMAMERKGAATAATSAARDQLVGGVTSAIGANVKASME